jgi:hypothetical protein
MPLACPGGAERWCHRRITVLFWSDHQSSEKINFKAIAEGEISVLLEVLSLAFFADPCFPSLLSYCTWYGAREEADYDPGRSQCLKCHSVPWFLIELAEFLIECMSWKYKFGWRKEDLVSGLHQAILGRETEQESVRFRDENEDLSTSRISLL